MSLTTPTQPAPSPPDRYTDSIAEFAASKGVTTRTVRNWIDAGIVDAIRVGPKLIRVDPQSMATLEPEGHDDDPARLEARRNLKAARLEDYITRTVSAAPTLTDAQRDRLAKLLRTVAPARELRRPVEVDERIAGGDLT